MLPARSGWSTCLVPLTRRAISLRLPAEMWAAVEARAEELGQTRTKFVERALEKALGAGTKAPESGEPTEAKSSSASPRAPTSPSLARFRQS